jgi:hypothetical protein
MPPNVGVLPVVSHPLKLTALAVHAVVALSAIYAVLTRIAPIAVLPTHHAQRCLYPQVGVVTFSEFPVILIPHVHDAHHHVRVGAYEL